MGISCGATVIKYILFGFNLLWIVLGVIILWLSFSITTWSSDLGTVLSSGMKTSSIVLLLVGFAIIIVAFLGCWGAVKENVCMLTTYGGIILILVILQIVGVYFAFKHRTDIENEVEKGIRKEFQKFDNSDKQFARVVQQIQKKFECCGIKSAADFSNNNIPASCCAQAFGSDYKTMCPRSNQKYRTGCVDAIKDKLKPYLGAMAGVAIVLIFIQLLIILSACCLKHAVSVQPLPKR